MSTGFKSSFVAIVGRPSAGKSSLLNTICGRKVSIVSSVPQTTRARVRGIVTREDGQLVFVDTPGFHTSHRRMNNHMKDLVAESLSEVEVALYVVDTTRAPGEEEEAIAALLGRAEIPILCALNKVDLPKADPDALEAFVGERLSQVACHRTSAETGEGINTLVDTIMGLAPEGEMMYPDEYYTDQDPEFRVSEIIREKAIGHVRQEIPHAIYVDVADMEERDNTLWIRAFVVVERESQKGIVVGHGGSIIKQIRVAAQREIRGLFSYAKIHLDLRVKVHKGWRKSEAILRRVVR